MLYIPVQEVRWKKIKESKKITIPNDHLYTFLSTSFNLKLIDSNLNYPVQLLISSAMYDPH